MSGLSARVQRIKVLPSSAGAQRVRDLKAKGRPILDLTIGEPRFRYTRAHQACCDQCPAIAKFIVSRDCVTVRGDCGADGT